MEALQRMHNRGSISTGYDIDNSCKFEPDNSEYLGKTPTSSGNRRTFTISMWIKRTEIGIDSYLMEAGDGDYNQSDRTILKFDSSDKIRFGGGSAYERTTNRVFRDTSAWYHIVMAVDTTDSTGGNRLKLYINGVQETSFGTSSDPSQNFQYAFCKDDEHTIGYNHTDNGAYFGGYMSEVILIDGQQLDPTSFGELDTDNNIWKPIDVSGLTFGTNGFYLDFKDSSNMGNDANGGTDFTENNITAADQATDTPTNNFCVMNMLDRTDGNSRNQEGGTKVTTDGGSGWCSMIATMGVTKGKWYWEAQRSGGSSDSNDVVVGIAGSEDDYIPYSSAAKYYIGNVAESSSMGFYTTGVPNVRNGSGDSLSNSAGDIIMIGLDLDNDKLYFGINGTWDGLGTGGSSIWSSFDDQFVMPAVAVYQGKQIKINFGGYASYTISSANSDADGYGTFEYAVPSGYYALCTKNLEEYG